MNALAVYLGVPPHPCLLQSTANGRDFVFSKTEAGKKISVTGLGHDVAKKSNFRYLNRLDQWRVAHIYRVYSEIWEYSSEAPAFRYLAILCFSVLQWIPSKSELIGWKETIESLEAASWRDKILYIESIFYSYLELRATWSEQLKRNDRAVEYAVRLIR